MTYEVHDYTILAKRKSYFFDEWYELTIHVRAFSEEDAAERTRGRGYEPISITVQR